MMIATDLKKLFSRDLDRLMTELKAYPNEASLWVKVDGINNAAGNLFMHLCGNLQHFIGAVLGDSGYVRQRDFEFEGTMTLEEITKEILETKKVLESYFDRSANADFQKEYPMQPFGYPMTISFFLIHLQSHLNYHLGQINYHRRILSEV